MRHALEPAFARLGPDATPEQVLALKVCDPAMGSGAFLVEACRQLAARLVAAWTKHASTRPPIADDEDEDLLARRLVAQRCLYGVDRNPLATDLARLSLWLATLARDHEFTFLDHALKSGDSLVGLTARQIAGLRWQDGQSDVAPFDGFLRERITQVTEGRRAIREAPTTWREPFRNSGSGMWRTSHSKSGYSAMPRWLHFLARTSRGRGSRRGLSWELSPVRRRRSPGQGWREAAGRWRVDRIICDHCTGTLSSRKCFLEKGRLRRHRR